MSLNKKKLFSELFNNFLSLNKNIHAIIVSDVEGFIIAGEKRRDVDMEIVSIMGVIVNPIMERLRSEFAFKEFGTANFDTHEHRLLFVSIEEKTTLSVVLSSMCSVEKIAPHAYYIAEKTAQIINSREYDNIQLALADFEIGDAYSIQNEEERNVIYKKKIEEGGSYRFKFIIIGDHEVGKSSIVRRFVGQKFNTDYRATMGLNIMSHTFKAFGNKINLDLWDVGAQDFFKRYRKIYYKGAQAAFLVFDLTNRKSFENTKVWHDELREFTEHKDFPIIIIGNKNDLVNKRLVSSEEGRKMAKDLSAFAEFYESSGLSDFSDLSELTESSDQRILYTETSALTGDNIDTSFNILSYHYILKSIEIEEKRVKSLINREIKLILRDNKKGLTVSFVSDNPLKNPCVELMIEIKELGNFSKEKDKKKEQFYKYTSGLNIKNHDYESFKSTDSDGIFCIFDTRGKEHIDPKWNGIIEKIIGKIKENKVVFIGLLGSDNDRTSLLIDEFKINEKLEHKKISLLFFILDPENRLEIYEQLELMIHEIKNLIFTY